MKFQKSSEPEPFLLLTSGQREQATFEVSCHCSARGIFFPITFHDRTATEKTDEYLVDDRETCQGFILHFLTRENLEQLRRAIDDQLAIIDNELTRNP
jgi:hypothetical protein